MTLYKDIADFEEDDRITMIGNEAMKGKTVAFVVENRDKALRYAKKLTEKFPEIDIGSAKPGPVIGTLIVKASKKKK